MNFPFSRMPSAKAFALGLQEMFEDPSRMTTEDVENFDRALLELISEHIDDFNRAMSGGEPDSVTSRSISRGGLESETTVRTYGVFEMVSGSETNTDTNTNTNTR